MPAPEQKPLARQDDVVSRAIYPHSHHGSRSLERADWEGRCQLTNAAERRQHVLPSSPAVTRRVKDMLVWWTDMAIREEWG